MQKIALFTFVFVLGVALGGGLRYTQVEAQFDSIETTNSFTPSGGSNLGAGGGGTCG